MTPEQKAAYVMAQSACLIAEVAAMQAENMVAYRSPDNRASPQFCMGDFRALIEKYGVHHNAVVTFFGS